MMSNARYIFGLLTIVCSAAFPVPALGSEDGGTRSPLFMGTGAREIAMGRTGAAISSGPNALFWNNARLARLQHPHFSFFNSKLIVDGVNYQAGFLAYPTLDFGSFALGFQRIGVTGIERTNERNVSSGTFDSPESHLLLGYSRVAGSYLSWGGTMRLAQQSVDNTSGTSVGLDLSVAFQRPIDVNGIHQLSLGANLQNINEPKMTLRDEEVAELRNIKLGAGYMGRTVSSKWAWALTGDGDFASTAGARIGLGAELTYTSILSVRAGLDAGDPTYGLGFFYRNIRFDYAMRSNDVLPRNDLITLSMQFGNSLRRRRNERMQTRQANVAAELENLLISREKQELENARRLAEVAYHAQDFKEARRLYRRVLTLQPSDQLAERQLDAIELFQSLLAASQALRQHQIAQSATLYQSILEQWPENPNALQGLDRARAQLQQSANRDRALKDLFKEALARFAEGRLIRAEATINELLHVKADHELANELLQRIRSVRYSQGQEELERSRRFAEKEEYGLALKSLKTVRKLLGSSTELDMLRNGWLSAREASRDKLAKNTREQQRIKALASKEDAAPQTPRHKRLSSDEQRDLALKYQEGLAAFGSGAFQRAIRNWQEIWLRDPSYESVANYLVKAYLLEGIELYGKGQYEEALTRCRRVLQIDPENKKAQRYFERIQEEKLELEQIGNTN